MSVKVVVRCRPLSVDEKREKSNIIVRMNGEEVQVVDCMEGRGGKFFYDEALWSTDVQVDGSSNPHASQDAVYRPVAFELFNHVITGYNGCIFAYGQTGSGKTYSMMGTPTDPGVIPRIAKNIFSEMVSLNNSGIETCVEVSFFEIYNEKVRCLLCPADSGFDDSTLRVREHPKFGPFVEGLTKFVVTTETDFLQLMHDGNKVRTAGATAMNAASSRSHAVFAVTITQRRANGRLVTTKTSKLNLVDLAGSERASKTLATGKRLAEGANINKSLTCLGNVISGLAEEQETGKPRHIPYRDSVLTWILKDNLGGNSKTVMLATISPSSVQYEETMSTLRYAERAKKIVNKAVVNESNNNEVIAALQKEIEELKRQLQGASEGERAKLSDELAASEAIQREFQMSLEEKLAETGRMMEEREKYMRQLEEELEVQRDEIKNLRHDNAEKERLIERLLQHIEEVQNKLGVEGAAEVEKLLEQVAVLESEQHATEIQSSSSNTTMSRAADDTTLRPENLGNVRPKQLEGGKVTVRALAKAFESLETENPVIQGKSNRDESLHFDPISLHVRTFEGKNTEQTITSETDEMLLELLGEDESPKNQEQEEEQELGYDKDILEVDEGLDLDLDLEEDGDEDIILEEEEEEEEADLEIDSDLDLDIDDIEAETEANAEEKESENVVGEEREQMAGEELVEVADEKQETYTEDSELENLSENEINEKDEDFLVDDSLEIDDNMQSDIYKEGSMKQKVNDSKDTVNVPVIASEVATDVTAVSAVIFTPTNITEEIKMESKAADSNIISSKVVGSSTATEPTDTFSTTVVSQHGGFLSPYPSITTLVVPSHALPNNRYLHELFKVIKVNDAAFIGNKKDRIWDVDFFRRRFANLDLAGYMSFEYPAANLYRVEKDPVHSKRLKLYFFEAPHPYELEFTSSERRQCFYEVSTTLRRNSIMWCPSLCLEGENDIILNVHGTTIERPNSKLVKVNGETKFMVARMPYEVVDIWYGCFSMRRRSLPQSAAVLGSFMPREPHEVYVIGVMDVPHDLIGNEEMCKYFLNYLGTPQYYALANTTLHSKKGQTNNAIIIIVRRSFIVRSSHIEAVETAPVCSDDVEKGAFTAVGCALRINEISMCIILINAKPTNCPASTRARCMRMLMGSFPFGDTLIDIGARFDYLIVSGAFNFGADFRENDMLLAQIKALNLMSDMVEAPPSVALVNSPEPIRIFYATRPRVSRLDIKQYTTSRALIMPNAFVSMDIYCQRAFLSIFGEKVHRVQIILDKLILSSPSRRIPPVYYSELRISGEWIENSPLFASVHNNGDEYILSGREVPRVVPTISSIDFLRLQTISFSLMGSLDPKPKKKKQILPIASGVLPLKNMFQMGEVIEFSIPLYYRACNVGTLTGTLLLVLYEKNTADLTAVKNERDVFLVVCYENQILDGKNWVPTVFSQHHAYNFSSSDATVECSRESYELPDPTKWIWLNLWRHDSLSHDKEGWMYSEGFDQVFFSKPTRSSIVRRRRWTRVMQASDPITLHNYLVLLQSSGQD